MWERFPKSPSWRHAWLRHPWLQYNMELEMKTEITTTRSMLARLDCCCCHDVVWGTQRSRQESGIHFSTIETVVMEDGVCKDLELERYCKTLFNTVVMVTRTQHTLLVPTTGIVAQSSKGIR